MSIFKYLTISHLQKVLAALEVRFTGVENEIEEINEININTSSRLNDIENNIPLPYDNLPNADFNNGTMGSSDLYARGDHRHPSDSSKANVSDVLTKTNTTQYLPTKNYHPATKLYVDTKCNEPVVGTGTVTISGTTASFTSLTPSQVTIYWSRKNPVYYYESLGQGTHNKRRYELISVVNDGSFYDFVFYGTDGSSDIYITTHIYSSNSEATGFNGTVHSYPSGVVQSDWNENNSNDGAYILNKPAIRAGDGENSITIGQIEQNEDAATYTIYVTGDANATTYSYTTEDTIEKTGRTAYVVEYNGQYFTFDSIDKENNQISFFNTLSLTALSNAEVKLYYHYKKVVGNNSVAEGSLSWSGGDNSHAEGSSFALGSFSHAEGNANVSQGLNSHAEGGSTVASGASSHTEGIFTKAIGSYAHAEGYKSAANALGSHVEGQQTIASSNYQHVQGKYNVEDIYGTYAHIVGNGTSSARSNAHTLDWSGNGWYAGKLTVGAAPTVDMDVATKKYVDDKSLMIVTITSSGSGDNITYSADKTFTEIKNHINNGGNVVCDYMGGTIYQLHINRSNELFFHYSETFDDDGIAAVAGRYIQFENNNNIFISDEAYYEIPTASSVLPSAPGAASIGSNYSYALADHIHPTDTTRAAVTDVLTKTNTTSYTPTANYHPATKKYVDDSIDGFSTDLSGLSDTSISSPSDRQLLKYNATTSKWENVTLSLAISGNTIQLKEGNTVISSITLPVYNGGVSS